MQSSFVPAAQCRLITKKGGKLKSWLSFISSSWSRIQDHQLRLQRLQNRDCLLCFCNCQMQNQAYWQLCMENESAKKIMFVQIKRKQIRSQRSHIIFVTRFLVSRTESLVGMEPSSLPSPLIYGLQAAVQRSVQLTLHRASTSPATHHPAAQQGPNI